MKSAALALAGLSLLCCGAAIAQEQKQPRATTRERVTAGAERQFQKLDGDKSGSVEKAEWDKSVDEMVARLRERMQKRFDEADANKDGKISKEEFVAARMKWFDDVDANHDGVLDRNELRDYNRNRARQERQGAQ